MKQLSTSVLCILGLSIVLHAAIIKVSDVLDIQVQGHEEFSGRYTVNTSGTIDYPLLADETIVNISTSELMNELTFRLAKHIDNPLVLISIVKKPNITVTVLGKVINPGPVETYLGASVQEVIQLAGGPAENAAIDSIKIIHSDGNDQTAKFFNMKAFLKEGNIDNMPTMQSGDIVILLSETRTTKVKVIGAVNKPGFFDLDEKMNVFEIIYLAGGPVEKADLSRVRRFFKSEGKTMEEVINVQTFIDKGDMDKIPIVEEGDVIIVYAKWFDWKILMSILTNVLLFIVTIQAIRGTVGGSS